MTTQPIVAICLLNQQELQSLGANFHHAYPIEDASSFSALLSAIDDADRARRRAKDEGAQRAD